MDWIQIGKYVTMFFYVINLILVIYASISMVFRKSDPVRTVTWIIILITLPYIGLILYIVFGQNFRKTKIYNRKGVKDLKIRKEISSQQAYLYQSNIDNMPPELRSYRKLIIQNINSNNSILAMNHSVDVYFYGKDALDSMLESIEKATNHIHLQSYIIADDIIGNKFKNLLIRKAKEGVLTRVIYDDVGCWSLPKKFIKDMTDAGIEVLCFSPVKIISPTSKINYRNHRKILVVDGLEGFIGGVNIADRYYTGGSFAEWRDTHIKIKGESIFSLQASFLLDRYFIKNIHIRRRKRYYPEITAVKTILDPEEVPTYAQVISSGPDSDWSSIMQVYFTAMTEAKKSIKIITPYFTPSETILNTIKIAALSGVDVKIMLPEKSDSIVTQYSTYSYISELLQAGVKVYLFKEGFNHSKVISIDNQFCIIGSANMDNRSFEYNFEITSILYDHRISEQIEDQFNKDIEGCILINKTEWKQRPRYVRFLESLARLFSPLL